MNKKETVKKRAYSYECPQCGLRIVSLYSSQFLHNVNEHKESCKKKNPDCKLVKTK